jgi:large subunit ribosomal protein L2
MGKKIRAQRKGRGSVHSAPGHRYKAEVRYRNVRRISAQVEDIVHDPGRTAPLLKVRYDDGRVGYALAPEGMSVDSKFSQGATIPVKQGNTLPLSEVPEGTPVFNIEAMAGDGGKFVRAAGTSATVVSKGAKIVIQLPSGQFKSFSPQCRATIGVVAGGGHVEKPIVKAGKKFWILSSKAKRYPTVAGVAMNPVNHPHGGGNHPHVGRPSTVSRNAPPGSKVGRLSPQKKKTRK